MCLALYGKEELDALQAMAKEKFSSVRNLNHEVVHFRGQPCTPEHLQIIVKAIPITEGHSLRFSWPVLPSLLHYKEAPLHYTSHLLEHEGKGSVLALLRELGWAKGLAAGESSSLHFAFLNVEVDLTDAGEEHVEEIIGLIFQYLSILRGEDGVHSWIFDELKAVADMQFHFQDKYSPFSYTSELAANMRIFPPEDWLAGNLPRVFDQQIISQAMEPLTPERVRIFVYSKKYTDVATEVEPWYGTQYNCEKIESSLLSKWKSSEVDPRLHLPAPNEFIPRDFSILNDADSSLNVPCVLKNSKMSRLWYKPDTKFLTPKAQLELLFICPVAYTSPEAVLLASIFSDLVNDYLSAYTYSAQVAGLSYGFSSPDDGFSLSVSGYNDKMMNLAKKIVAAIVNFEVKEDRFSIMKENIQKSLINRRFEQPLDQAAYNGFYLMIYKNVHFTEMLEVLPTLTAETLQQFIPQLFNRVFLECFISGNVTSAQAEDFLQHVEDSLSNGVKSKPAFSSHLKEKRTIRLEDGANFTYPTTGRNPEDENSGLYLSLQLGPDETQLNVLSELLRYMMNKECFHQLRTIEQLGYVVDLQSEYLYGIRSLDFYIQSTVKDPESLEARVEAFLEQYQETLEKMSREDFETNLESYIKLKLEKHKNIWEEIGELWGEIRNGTLKFTRGKMEASAARNIKKQEVVEFYSTYVLQDAPRRRKLSCQVYGNKHLDAYKVMKGEEAHDSTSLLVSDASQVEPESKTNPEPMGEAITATPPKVPEEILDSQADGGRAVNLTKDSGPVSNSHTGVEHEGIPSNDTDVFTTNELVAAHIKEEAKEAQERDGNVIQPTSGLEKKFQHEVSDGEESLGAIESNVSVKEVNAPKATEGNDGQKEAKSKRRRQLIDDMDAFKRSQSLYGSLWGGMHHHHTILQLASSVQPKEV
ncbi:hypothetical protein R1flu_022426 [Riccia fluitans]|uniref:Insulin-degrading enzyme-like 1, peroxisomal n=1 Tax=Riccia fluitans TaxID=41844 RepID=A0ABD1XDW7_9MARC